MIQTIDFKGMKFKVEDMVPVTGLEIAHDHPALPEADIDEILNNFDSNYHEPPVTIGHPEENEPVLGKVEKIYKDGKKMLADLKVLPDFLDMLQKGIFKERSISVYKDFEGTGKKVLRHLGFVPIPRIKGMEQATFSDSKGGYDVIEFSDQTDWKFSRIADVLSILRDYFIETLGREEADKLISTWTIDDIKAKIDEADAQEVGFSELLKKDFKEISMPNDKGTVQYSEDQLNALVNAAVKEALGAQEVKYVDEKETLELKFAEEKKGFEEQIATLQSNLEAEKKKSTDFSERIETLEGEKVKLTVENFCDSMVKEGKMLPAEKDNEVLNLSELSEDRRNATMTLIKAREPMVKLGGHPGGDDTTDYSENPAKGGKEKELRDKEKGIFPEDKDKGGK